MKSEGQRMEVRPAVMGGAELKVFRCSVSRLDMRDGSDGLSMCREGGWRMKMELQAGGGS